MWAIVGGNQKNKKVWLFLFCLLVRKTVKTDTTDRFLGSGFFIIQRDVLSKGPCLFIIKKRWPTFSKQETHCFQQQIVDCKVSSVQLYIDVDRRSLTFAKINVFPTPGAPSSVNDLPIVTCCKTCSKNSPTPSLGSVKVVDDGSPS